MEIKDQHAARVALGILAVVFFVDAGLSSFSLGLTLLPLSLDFESVYRAEMVLWVLVAGAMTWAVWELGRAVRSELLWGALGSSGVMVLLEIYFTWDMFTREPGQTRSQLLSLATAAILLAMTVSLCLAIGKLGRTTAFAAGIIVVAVVRTLSSVALALRLSDHPPLWVFNLRSFISIAIAAALGALALHARKGVSGETNVLTGPVAQQPIVEASGMRLVIVGVALLVLGIGGSAVSFSAASSSSGGGRYVVFTGAIATGLVQVVRGIARLGKGS